MEELKGEARRKADLIYVDAIKRNSLIDAIKAYRMIHNCSIKEAMDHIKPRWDTLRKVYAHS